MADKTLAEVKEILRTDKIHEAGTAFLVNDFGKYRPNITFVVPKDFERSPIAYRSDEPTHRMLDNMNVGFGGETSVLFGNYWKSQKGGACFRPKPIADAQHVLIRCGWGGAFSRTRGIGYVDDAPYSRRAASNGGGLGTDYVVVPIGYYRVVRDAEIDGEAPAVQPNFADRAKAIREEFARFDQEQSDKADAAAKAKAEAEAASREAKLSGLGERVEAVNRRREVVGQSPYEVGETAFGFTSSYSSNVRLYTEANVAAAEREVTQLEEKAALKAAIEELRTNFGPTVEAKGCHLGTPDYLDSSFAQFTLEAKDVELRRSFRCSLEGIDELKAAWPEFLKEVEAKRLEAKRAAEKEALEQSLREQGLPTDFTCHHERGHGKTHRQCWVIRADGKEREADEEVYSNHKHVATKWNVIRPGEVALMWEKGSARSEHRFTVVHMLTETPTDEQVETICAILEGIEQHWQDARGLASGAPSPDVGEGWLHPVTGKSLTPGFKTSRQQRQAGKLPTAQPNLDEPIKSVLLAKPVAEGGERASTDALATLRAHFGK